jgi:hypothetical protein
MITHASWWSQSVCRPYDPVTLPSTRPEGSGEPGLRLLALTGLWSARFFGGKTARGEERERADPAHARAGAVCPRAQVDLRRQPLGFSLERFVRRGELLGRHRVEVERVARLDRVGDAARVFVVDGVAGRLAEGEERGHRVERGGFLLAPHRRRAHEEADGVAEQPRRRGRVERRVAGAAQPLVGRGDAAGDDGALVGRVLGHRPIGPDPDKGVAQEARHGPRARHREARAWTGWRSGSRALPGSRSTASAPHGPHEPHKIRTQAPHFLTGLFLSRLRSDARARRLLRRGPAGRGAQRGRLHVPYALLAGVALYQSGRVRRQVPFDHRAGTLAATVVRREG